MLDDQFVMDPQQLLQRSHSYGAKNITELYFYNPTDGSVVGLVDGCAGAVVVDGGDVGIGTSAFLHPSRNFDQITGNSAVMTDMISK